MSGFDNPLRACLVRRLVPSSLEWLELVAHFLDLKVQRRSIFVLSGIDLTKRWTHLKPRCLWSPSYVNKRPSQLQHAQQFVNIKVQISWQAQHLVNFMEGRRYCHYHCHTTLPLPDYFHTTIPLPDYHTTTTLTLPQVQQSCLLTQNFVWGLLLASYELVPCESFGTISVTHAQLKWDGAAVGRRGSTLF